MPYADDGVHSVFRVSKKKYRSDSDLCANYGAGALGRLNARDEHERRFGLYLNMERIQAWDALAIGQGVGLAMGNSSPEFFGQIYENKYIATKIASLSKRKGTKA